MSRRKAAVISGEISPFGKENRIMLKIIALIIIVKNVRQKALYRYPKQQPAFAAQRKTTLPPAQTAGTSTRDTPQDRYTEVREALRRKHKSRNSRLTESTLQRETGKASKPTKSSDYQ